MNIAICDDEKIYRDEIEHLVDEYFADKNYKNVFNLDGGGSVQTVFNHHFINFPVIDNDTESGRPVPSAIGFRTEAINFE